METLKAALSAFAPDFEPYILFLYNRLSPPRFLHSLEVGLAMGQAFKIYIPEDEEICENDWILAGLLHDVMKEVPVTDQIWWVNKCQAKLRPPEKLYHPFYLHGPASAAFAQYALGVGAADPFFVAISQHTGNFPEMPLFSRCLHVADMTVPVKRYPGCKKLAATFYGGKLDEAELLLKTWARRFLIMSGIIVDPAFTMRINQLTEVVKPGPNFFDLDETLIKIAPR
ncbi:MAG: HD domain-containing protein [Patescibacteria group bacterium]|nr:HD domain-containing protein [Patescibacteria group bacterium]